MSDENAWKKSGEWWLSYLELAWALKLERCQQLWGGSRVPPCQWVWCNRWNELWHLEVLQLVRWRNSCMKTLLAPWVTGDAVQWKLPAQPAGEGRGWPSPHWKQIQWQCWWRARLLGWAASMGRSGEFACNFLTTRQVHLRTSPPKAQTLQHRKLSSIKPVTLSLCIATVSTSIYIYIYARYMKTRHSREFNDAQISINNHNSNLPPPRRISTSQCSFLQVPQSINISPFSNPLGTRKNNIATIICISEDKFSDSNTSAPWQPNLQGCWNTLEEHMLFHLMISHGA